MEKTEDTKIQILTKASELFLQFGIRRITMDDIARELGISKKTIYLHFKDKEEIIVTATNHHMEKECEKMSEIKKQSGNAVEHLFLISKCMRDSFGNINASILYDLKKYYANAWNHYQEFERKYIYHEIVQTLEKGIKEGHFRKDINVEILATLRKAEIQMSFDKDLFNHESNSLFEIQSQLLEHFTYGILTQKGLDLLESYKKQLIHEE